MGVSSRNLLLWSPRVLGILTALFLGLFALDAFGEGRSFAEALPAFLVHASPAFLLLLVVAVSWRREWVGGAVFLALAALYSVAARNHPGWIPIVSGPLAAVGALFLLSWRLALRGEPAGREGS